MTYATRQDLEDRYTAEEVAQLEASGRDIGKALSDADSEIDSYLSQRYSLPITDVVPDRLIAAAADIARYRLYGVNSEGEPADRYEGVIRWLRDVAKGIADVVGLTPRGDSTAAVGVGNVSHGQAKSRFDWGGF